MRIAATWARVAQLASDGCKGSGNRRHLGAGGAVARLEIGNAADRAAGNEILCIRPGKVSVCPAAHIAHIRVRSQIRACIRAAPLPERVAAEDRRDLLARHIAVRVEAAVSDASDNIMLRCPEHAVGIPVRADVREGIAVRVRRLALHAPEHAHEHGARHRSGGKKRGVGRADKQAVRDGIVNALVRPVSRAGHIGKASARALCAAVARLRARLRRKKAHTPAGVYAFAVCVHAPR